MNATKAKNGRNACLDETKINRYVLQQSSEKERQEIEAHLATCPQCCQEVALLTKMQPEIQDERKWAKITSELYYKSTDLVKNMIGATVSTPKVSVLEIFIRFVSEKWEIVRHTGRIMPQAALPARGDIPKKETILSNIVKEFHEFRVETDVIGNVEGTVDLRIRVKRLEDMRLEPQVQFTLLDKKRDRTLEKSTQDGEIFFEGLTPGLYSIQIAHQERPIGEIVFCTESPQD